MTALKYNRDGVTGYAGKSLDYDEEDEPVVNEYLLAGMQMRVSITIAGSCKNDIQQRRFLPWRSMGRTSL